VLLTVENQGINNASYIIDVSGTGSSFVQLNPGILTLKPGKSETLYLYIFPPANTKEGMYEANIAARLKDTAILSSKKLEINVVQAKESEENVPEVINETAAENITKTNILSDIGNWFSNAFASIGKFFSGLFTIQSPAAETLANETIVSEAANETAGNLTIESNETQTAANETITETAGNETAVNETQTTNETVTEAANQTITDENETAANETSTFPIQIGNVTIIEVNETAGNETLVNQTIVSNETAANQTAGSETAANETAGNLTIESNETQTSANETAESSSDQAQNFDLKSFLIENKSYIVGAIIIILIILLFATGLWRRIIDFFETEEVEE
jgi:hypothetical protein